jgi:beta-galactosidase
MLKKINSLPKNFIRIFLILGLVLIANHHFVAAQGVKFMRDISPSEGLVKPQESPYREEICLNGSWDFQPVEVPAVWKTGTGIPPELTPPLPDKWEKTKIKIPSPWNVNEWGGGSRVGKGTNSPYAPGSVYYPGYPRSWGRVRMAWMKRSFPVPPSWDSKRIILHFEAVMGEFVVMVNGQKVAQHFGDYMPYEVDITDVVRMDKANELMVGVKHRRLFEKTDPLYKYFRTTYPPGSNTADLAGIWQDVYLFGLSQLRVTDVFVKPWVDKDLLEFDVQLTNQTKTEQKISVNGSIKEWINKTSDDVLSAPEIKWELGKNEVLKITSDVIALKPGEWKTITISTKVQEKLKYWNPVTPNLYTVLISVGNKKQVFDCKTERFGWRQLTIRGKDFYLNGVRIQCFGDIQHPFGAYVCSRRFAWAWLKMIKDFGGNAVRFHAQPWPRFYYDLADEMGMMVLDEAALFGSALNLNFGEAITWERTAHHIEDLILRDRNHPSVIGWSTGNELFAIRNYNKPAKEVADIWDAKIIELAKWPAVLDPTRQFITDDGDEDMNGNLPVWSKHFAEGLTLNRLPGKVTKPLVIGEQGATYYGKPGQHLYKFAGEKPFESYYGRNEALAIDLYQNVIRMVRPLLAYFSPSEVCWFGIEHMNLGYKDYTRLPDSTDGVFAGLPYVEGKPGYQIERIPPYVSTFNPGLDPELPLYKPLPMFEALQAALAKDIPQPCKWDTYCGPVADPKKPDFQKPVFPDAFFAGDTRSMLRRQLVRSGIKITFDDKTAKLVIVDGENLTQENLKKAERIIGRVKKEGGLIWVMISDQSQSPVLSGLLPAKLELTDRQATSLKCNKSYEFEKYFKLPDLYFSEVRGDNKIMKQGLSGDLVNLGTVVFEATNVDWSLFINSPENRKCAQVVLYEHLIKPSGIAMISCPYGNSVLILSTLDYKNSNPATDLFWRNLYGAMGIKFYMPGEDKTIPENRTHDLLMDGPLKK